MHRLNQISAAIVDVAVRVHKELGPGLLESVYQTIMAYELRKRGLRVSLEVPLPVIWDSLKQDVGFRADLIVENSVIVEIKSLEVIHPVHLKVLMTYLRVSDRRLGLLLNFGAVLMKEGIHRVVNQMED